MTILSVDLAYKRYRDLGIVALRPGGAELRCDLLPHPEFVGDPDPVRLATWLAETASRLRATSIMLDGPQAWKAADNGLEHSRVCERELNAPGKTGLPGHAKPRNYLGFITFSIDVFSELDRLGWPRASKTMLRSDSKAESPCTIESLPMAAWRTLGLPALRAKSKAKPQDLANRFEDLLGLYPRLTLSTLPSHDQLQALVAGLGVVELRRGDDRRTRIAGIAPHDVDGIPREGFIVCPSIASDA